MLNVFGVGRSIRTSLVCRYSGGAKCFVSLAKTKEKIFFNKVKGQQQLVAQGSLTFFTLLNDNALGFYLRRFFKRRILVLKKSRCWRGVRHEQHLPVRGQRSKTNAGTRKKRLA